MKIKFHETLYDLVGSNAYSGRFQATIEKGEHTYDSIIEDTLDAEEIIIYDDEDEVKGIYTDYTKRIAITIQSDNYISIELQNTDFERRLQELNDSVALQQTSIDNLNSQVSDLTPYVDSQKAYFSESEKTFYNVPEGNISVFFDNYNGDYSINRVSDRVTVSFDPLEQETTITIKVE